MKGKILFGAVLVGMMFNSVSAETAVNTSITLDPKSEFERIHGATCAVATDGCNSYTMKEGKVFAGTKKMCNKPITWYCTQQKIDHELMTQTDTGLSFNDLNFYKKISTSLGKKYINRIDKSIQNYKNKLEEKRSLKQVLVVNKKIEAKIEKMTSDLLMRYPQDIGLPEKVNKKYFVLKYLSFELQKYSFIIQKGIDTPKMNVNTLSK